MVTDINPAKRALAQAKEEIDKEKIEKAVKKFKDKLRQLEDAKIIVKNLERELSELEDEIGQL